MSNDDTYGDSWIQRRETPQIPLCHARRIAKCFGDALWEKRVRLVNGRYGARYLCRNAALICTAFALVFAGCGDEDYNSAAKVKTKAEREDSLVSEATAALLDSIEKDPEVSTVVDVARYDERHFDDSFLDVVEDQSEKVTSRLSVIEEDVEKAIDANAYALVTANESRGSLGSLKAVQENLIRCLRLADRQFTRLESARTEFYRSLSEASGAISLRIRYFPRESFNAVTPIGNNRFIDSDNQSFVIFASPMRKELAKRGPEKNPGGNGTLSIDGWFHEVIDHRERSKMRVFVEVMPLSAYVKRSTEERMTAEEDKIRTRVSAVVSTLDSEFRQFLTLTLDRDKAEVGEALGTFREEYEQLLKDSGTKALSAELNATPGLSTASFVQDVEAVNAVTTEFINRWDQDTRVLTEPLESSFVAAEQTWGNARRLFDTFKSDSEVVSAVIAGLAAKVRSCVDVFTDLRATHEEHFEDRDTDTRESLNEVISGYLGREVLSLANYEIADPEEGHISLRALSISVDADRYCGLNDDGELLVYEDSEVVASRQMERQDSRVIFTMLTGNRVVVVFEDNIEVYNADLTRRLLTYPRAVFSDRKQIDGGRLPERYRYGTVGENGFYLVVPGKFPFSSDALGRRNPLDLYLSLSSDPSSPDDVPKIEHLHGMQCVYRDSTQMVLKGTMGREVTLFYLSSSIGSFRILTDVEGEVPVSDLPSRCFQSDGYWVLSSPEQKGVEKTATLRGYDGVVKRTVTVDADSAIYYYMSDGMHIDVSSRKSERNTDGDLQSYREVKLRGDDGAVRYDFNRSWPTRVCVVDTNTIVSWDTKDSRSKTWDTYSLKVRKRNHSSGATSIAWESIEQPYAAAIRAAINPQDVNLGIRRNGGEIAALIACKDYRSPTFHHYVYHVDHTTGKALFSGTLDEFNAWCSRTSRDWAQFVEGSSGETLRATSTSADHSLSAFRSYEDLRWEVGDITHEAVEKPNAIERAYSHGAWVRGAFRAEDETKALESPWELTESRVGFGVGATIAFGKMISASVRPRSHFETNGPTEAGFATLSNNGNVAVFRDSYVAHYVVRPDKGE